MQRSRCDVRYDKVIAALIWVTDLTYVPTGEGWLYLAGHKDLYTGEFVGCAMGDRMTQQLVGDSFQMGLISKRQLPGLIHHSDQGSPVLVITNYY